MSIQAMFHGGPLNDQRMMRPTAEVRIYVPIAPKIDFSADPDELILAKTGVYERESVTRDLLEAAERHEIAIRYFYDESSA